MKNKKKKTLKKKTVKKLLNLTNILIVFFVFIFFSTIFTFIPSNALSKKTSNKFKEFPKINSATKENLIIERVKKMFLKSKKKKKIISS